MTLGDRRPAPPGVRPPLAGRLARLGFTDVARRRARPRRTRSGSSLAGRRRPAARRPQRGRRPRRSRWPALRTAARRRGRAGSAALLARPRRRGARVRGAGSSPSSAASVALGDHLARHPDHWRVLGSAQDAAARPPPTRAASCSSRSAPTPDRRSSRSPCLDGTAGYDALRVAYRRRLLALAARDLTGDSPASSRSRPALAELAGADPRGGARDRPQRARRPAPSRAGSPSSRWASAAGASSTTSATSTCSSSPSRSTGGDETGRAGGSDARSRPARCRSARRTRPRARSGRSTPSLRPEGRQGALVRTLASPTSPTTSGGRAPGSSRRCSRPGPSPATSTLGDGVRRRRRAASVERGRTDRTSSRTCRRCGVASRSTSPPRQAERQLKLGRGGLRDVEFAVQLLQLVHGRTDVFVRSRVHPRGARAAVDPRVRRPRRRGRARPGVPVPAHHGAPAPAAPAAPHPRRARRRAPSCAGSPARSASASDPVDELTAEWRRHRARCGGCTRSSSTDRCSTRSPGCDAEEARLTPEAALERGSRRSATPTPSAALRHIEALTAGVSQAGGDPADAAAGDARLVRRRTPTPTPGCSASGR